MRKLGITRKRWLLTLHLLFSAIMLGVAIVFLFLSITAANTNDEGVLQACYTMMHMLAKTTVRYSTIAALATGILLSVWTPWGLFKHYWIIAKEVLTFFFIIIGPIGMYWWTLRAVTLVSSERGHAVLDPDFIVNSGQLRIGIVLQIVSLVGLFAISVFKPWGSRKR
ncbi:DUF2269 family protein [Cohnella nanjingensis]|uniref:DUF2269 family protein n=1 Tax=Cohnella nanjingensis TaxID=1387779 RepID=A0A7X0VF30_9BACL|nr:DUF2269 family protein [Cohnella nanjingensis]